MTAGPVYPDSRKSARPQPDDAALEQVDESDAVSTVETQRAEARSRPGLVLRRRPCQIRLQPQRVRRSGAIEFADGVSVRHFDDAGPSRHRVHNCVVRMRTLHHHIRSL